MAESEFSSRQSQLPSFSLILTAPLVKLFKSYKACCTPKERVWAEEDWLSPSVVAGQKEEFAKESSLRPRKWKAILCVVLGAAVIAA